MNTDQLSDDVITLMEQRESAYEGAKALHQERLYAENYLQITHNLQRIDNTIKIGLTYLKDDSLISAAKCSQYRKLMRGYNARVIFSRTIRHFYRPLTSALDKRDPLQGLTLYTSNLLLKEVNSLVNMIQHKYGDAMHERLFGKPPTR